MMNTAAAAVTTEPDTGNGMDNKNEPEGIPYIAPSYDDDMSEKLAPARKSSVPEAKYDSSMNDDDMSEKLAPATKSKLPMGKNVDVLKELDMSAWLKGVARIATLP